MCVICISPKGAPQPDTDEIKRMFERNPHGAGYMVARKNKVELHKGFMLLDDLLYTLKQERFSEEDAVVYHFRISTQAGVNPEMTQPFPFSRDLAKLEALDVICPLGVAHNGVIRLTSDGNPRYSDTALFISNYLPRLIKRRRDLQNPEKLRKIESIIQSKMAFLDGSGNISLVGNFTEENGIYYSNTYHKITKHNVKMLDLLSALSV